MQRTARRVAVEEELARMSSLLAGPRCAARASIRLAPSESFVLAPHRPLPRLRGRDREGDTDHDRAFHLAPSPTLPRLRGREQTELAARRDSISPGPR